MKVAALLSKTAPAINRAYSLLTVKAVEEIEEDRVIRGIATTPEADRVGDIVEPRGVKFTNPLPLLWMHRHDSPVGTVKFRKATDDGIEFEARIAKITTPGVLKDLVDMAWQAVKAELVRGVSIGFRALEYSFMENGGVRFTETEVFELSLVTIPANASALITSAKSLSQFDGSQRAVSRVSAGPVKSLFGPTGVPVNPPTRTPEHPTMNIQEQIKQFQATRAAKVAAMAALMKKAAEAGETLDKAASEEYDNTQAEVDTIDAHLKRLENMQKVQLVESKAITVVTPGSVEEPTKKATEERDPTRRVIAVERKLEKGIGLARLAGCIAAAKGNTDLALRIAKERFPEEKQLHGILQHVRFNDHGFINKAAVDIGTSRDTDWAAPLVNYQNLVNEFLEYLRPMTIIDQMAPSMRRVPFNVRVPRQTGGASASWVGEGAPKPVTSLAFDFVSLTYMKLAAIAVITQELARFSSPNADTLVRDDLAKAIVQQMDADFVDPANAGTSNVKPASITNGVTPVASSGNSYANVLEDIQALAAPFIAANLSRRGAVWLMSESNALALSLMRLPANEGGGFAFPGVTEEGGTFSGRKVIVSEAIGNIVVLARASDILLADDGQVTIDASDQASVQMDSVPTNPVVSATVLISLWQQNLLGIRAERFITWVKGRAASVQYLSGVNWGQPTT
jgi:HK97 family phage major capsid protein/HK97 family phage prohead protease